MSRVVLIEGAPEGDLTGGHVDGIARFIDADRVVVADCSETSACAPDGHDDQIYDGAAAALSAAGLEVIRWPFAGSVEYRGETFDTDYMNWLVGDGFVITVGFDDAEADDAAVAQLEAWFPDRDVYSVETLASWYAGGGVHCHTNDQPSFDPQVGTGGAGRPDARAGVASSVAFEEEFTLEAPHEDPLDRPVGGGVAPEGAAG